MQAGLSQEQLAARAQVAVATVRKIEKGAVIEPGYFTVLALMHALGATREDGAVLGGAGRLRTPYLLTLVNGRRSGCIRGVPLGVVPSQASTPRRCTYPSRFGPGHTHGA